MESLQQREEGKLRTLRSVDVWSAFLHLPGRENCYQNIYNFGPIMGELVTLSKNSGIGFKMFTLPSSPAASVFLPQPQSHPGKNMWISLWWQGKPVTREGLYSVSLVSPPRIAMLTAGYKGLFSGFCINKVNVVMLLLLKPGVLFWSSQYKMQTGYKIHSGYKMQTEN